MKNNIIFIASLSEIKDNTYGLGDGKGLTTEWDAWKTAVEKCNCTKVDNSEEGIIILRYDSDKVFIVKVWDAMEHDFVNGLMERTLLDKDAIKQSEIYIHGNDSLANALLQDKIKSGSYSALTPNKTLFKSVKTLILTLNKGDCENFFKEAKNIWQSVIIKTLYMNMNIQFLSIVLDITGLNECRHNEKEKYAEDIIKDKDRFMELKTNIEDFTKLIELKEDQQAPLIEGIKEVTEPIINFCEFLKNDFSNKNGLAEQILGKVKEYFKDGIHKHYQKLLERIKSLYEG